MKLAHLIMCHKEPTQLERLIKALAHEGVDFYIHLDKRAAIADFEHLTQLKNVQFIQPRFFVRWASYGFTHAILESIRFILKTYQNYDFINLMSAQDYPIKPVASVYHFFNNHLGQSFLAFEANGSEWWKHAITRVEKYHTTYYSFKGQYLLQTIINKVLPKRKFPLPYTLYGSKDGSWWTMSKDCAAYLVQFIDQNPELRRFMRFTWGSDEFLLATILLNSPLKDTIINNNYRYIDWSAGGANPKLLTMADLPALVASDKFFARKFDIQQDADILDALDKVLKTIPAPAHIAAYNAPD